MVYLCVIFLFFICIWKYDIKKECYCKKETYYGLVSILIIISSFSYRIGSDTIAYEMEYKSYQSFFDTYNSSVNIGREYGWIFVSKICKSFFDNFLFFKIVHAFFVNYCISRLIKKYTKYPFSCLFLYFFVLYFPFNFEILRQSVAISFFCLAVPHWEKQKWLWYFLLVLMGALFHESAFLLCLLPLFKFVRVNLFSLIILSMLLLGLPLYAANLSSWLLDQLIGVDTVKDKAYFYLAQDSTSTTLSLNNLMSLLLYVIIPVFYIIKQKKHQYCIYRLAYFSILLFVFSLFIPIFYRFNNFFQLFLLILFVDIFNSISDYPIFRKKRSILFSSCLIIFIGVKSVGYMQRIDGTKYKNYMRYYPYSSIFYPVKDQNREGMFIYMSF